MFLYAERAARVACESKFAVQVLLSSGNDDIAFIILNPQSAEYFPREEFIARKLRSVGVCGLIGLKPVCVFKEPFSDDVVHAIAEAFVAYIGTLVPGVTAQMTAELDRKQAGDFVQFAGALWSLVDPR
jgi:hypothetical protein